MRLEIFDLRYAKFFRSEIEYLKSYIKKTVRLLTFPVHTNKIMNRKELEDRLIDFAVMIVDIVDDIPKLRGRNHLLSQLARSGTSPALNYAESQSAESRKDFIHKISISLKELRETLVCLTIIQRSKKYKTNPMMISATKECDELVSIFVKSIQTAKKKLR